MPPEAMSPWEKTPDETQDAFDAFVIYRDMGPGRTLVKVGQECGKHRTLMERWSATHAWVARVEAWDAELDRERRAGMLAQAREADHKNLELVAKVREKLLAALDKVLDPSQLTAHQWARLWRDQVTIERTILGQPTSVDPANGEGTDDDMAALGAAMKAWFERERTEAEAKAFMDGAAAASEVQQERTEP